MKENTIITDIFTLKDIFSVVAAIVDNCGFFFSEKGLRIATIDPANIALLEMDIPKEDFKEYNITDICIIEMRSTDILKIIDDKKGSEPVEIFIETTNRGEDKEESIIRFKIRNLAHIFISSRPRRKDRNSEYLTKDCIEVLVSLDFFQEAMSACNRISNYVLFESKADKIRIYCEDTARRIETFIDHREDKKISSIFSLDYLNDIANAINVANNSKIILYLGYNWSMTIRFKVGKYGSGTFNIAPRIEPE